MKNADCTGGLRFLKDYFGSYKMLWKHTSHTGMLVLSLYDNPLGFWEKKNRKVWLTVKCCCTIIDFVELWSVSIFPYCVYNFIVLVTQVILSVGFRYQTPNSEWSNAPAAPCGSVGWTRLHRWNAHPQGCGHSGILWCPIHTRDSREGKTDTLTPVAEI